MSISRLASIDDLNGCNLERLEGPEREELDLLFRIVSKHSSSATKLEWEIVSKGRITNIKYFYLSWTLERSKKLRKHY